MSDPFGLTRPPYSSAPGTTPTSWPLKSESSLLSSQEKQRRESEERRQKEEKERKQRERERKEREKREREFRERNGSLSSTPESLHRRRDSSRSPARPNSHAATGDQSPLVKRDEHHPLFGHHLPPHHRPSSALDMSGRLSSSSSSFSSEAVKREGALAAANDCEITVISEKDGNTTIAHQPAGSGGSSTSSSHHPTNGRASVSSIHSERSPSVSSLKKESAATKSTLHGGGRAPSAAPASAAKATTAITTSTSSVFGAAAGAGFPGLSPYATGLIPPLPGASPLAPPSSLLAGGLAADPFRDPYRALSMYGAAAAAAAAAKDPLREARERELLRLDPLGSMIMNEQERARLAALGYPPTTPAGLPPTGLPSSLYPPTSLGMLPGASPLSAAASGLSKPPNPMSALYHPPGPPIPGFPPGAAAAAALGSLGSLGHPRLTPPLGAAGASAAINGHAAPGAAPAIPGKDPLVR